MCSVTDKSESKVKPCDLCGGSTDGNSKSSLRGLVLCYDCDAGLGGKKFSATIVQQERRAANAGGQFVDRPPLPVKLMRYLNGPAIVPAAELSPPPAPSPIDPPAEIPETRVGSPPAPAAEPIKAARPACKPRQPRPAPISPPAPIESRPIVRPAEPRADDWRTNGRRIAAMAY